MKHIRKFNSLNAAKDATLYSPLVVSVSEGDVNKILIKQDGDKEMQIDPSVTDINNLSSDNVIVKQTGPEMVDLGLTSGTLWAKCNIGAATETAAGKYFAWGDAEGFEASEVSDDIFSYDWYATRPGASLTYDISDTDAAHNAVYKAYGTGYTLPSKVDFEELISGTNNEWTTINGVNGRKFTNKTDSSKYIFIPAAGYGYNGSIYYVGIEGSCWSSTYGNSNSAYYLYFFDDGGIDVLSDDRCYGFSVRAIQKQSQL